MKSLDVKKKEGTVRDLNELLKKVSAYSGRRRKQVIYGVYDRSAQPLLTRLDDFIVDHSHVPLQEKAYFFHLLAVMIDAGIPLIQSVKMLANRTKHERFRRILDTCAFSIGQGKRFSEAMSRFPDVFGEMEIGVVRSGEAAGNMEKMLFKLSEQLDKSHELQMKLVTASIYPIAVLAVLVVVAAGMLLWIIPGLVDLLREGGLQDKDFPFATKFLIGLSSAFSNYWWAIAFGVLILFLIFKVYIGSDNGRFKWDLFKLKIPVIGTLRRRVLVLRFVSMLGILIDSGLPVVHALKIIATSLSSEIYRLKTWEVIAKVQSGEKISMCLADAPFLFDETVTQMLGIAEQSASIGLISDKIASHYDREIDNALKRLTSLFEPIMIVFVGATVAILALAILTPIFQLSSLV
ncbi:type II secretion system F family protein [Patescibacteria group bacterium]|nr:type II secretion system F family protein [Patescibacteria group bacterium]MBU1703032.1 type II secretion system F family protein [Patescibacteria group bacterium]MBU1953920.1 type II secretion system F family protein [Patescibacteria group bacterium]